MYSTAKFDDALKNNGVFEKGQLYVTTRYFEILRHVYRWYLFTSIVYHVLINMVSLMGLALTVLAGVSNSTTMVNNNVVHWWMIVIPIIIVFFNKIVYSTDISGVRIVYGSLLKKLESECEFYLYSSDRYKNKLAEDALQLFIERIEAMTLKLVNLDDRDPNKVSDEIVAFAPMKRSGKSSNVIVDMPHLNRGDGLISSDTTIGTTGTMRSTKTTT